MEMRCKSRSLSILTKNMVTLTHAKFYTHVMRVALVCLSTCRVTPNCLFHHNLTISVTIVVLSLFVQ